MGKKTEEMMTGLETALVQWQTLGRNFSIKAATLPPAVKLRDEKKSASQKYYESRGWHRNTAGREEAMVADPVFQRLEKEWEDAFAKEQQISNALEGIKPHMRAARLKVVELLTAFEKFINEKDKSINPLKKKSVPAARELIKKVRAALPS